MNRLKKWLYRIVVRQLIEDQTFFKYISTTLLDDKEFIRDIYVATEKEHAAILEERLAKDRAIREEAVLKNIAKRLADVEKRQTICSHLKGQRHVKGYCDDFNIRMHTFSDNTTTVKCLTCGKEWRGEQLKSTEVQYMLNRTTNTQTSSEVSHGKPVNWSEPPHIAVDPIEDARIVEEMENNPLWPWASRVYVSWWDKMLKKLRRKKKAV